MKAKNWMMALLLLLIPACAMAVTEGVVEEAPPVGIESTQKAEVSYLPDAGYYAGAEDIWEQYPQLTPSEIERAHVLAADYKAGKVTGDGAGVLCAMENVVVGVYPLDPKDFDGERVYVILPFSELTDEQLLAIIDAHDRLGLEFDPEGLSYRNCMRGGGVECSRFFTAEERERYSYMSDRIRRGEMSTMGIDPDEAGLLCPKLNEDEFCGLQDFTIRPYRRITDEEMIAQLIVLGVKDESGTIDFAGVERSSREILCARLACPLSMKLDYVYGEGSYMPCVFDAQGRQGYEGEGRPAFGTTFSYYNDAGNLVYADVMVDWESGIWVKAGITEIPEVQDERSERAPEVTDAVCEQAAAAYARDVLGLEGLTWMVTGEQTWTNWGSSIVVRAQVEEDCWMTMFVGAYDGQVHNVLIERGRLVPELPKEEMPVNG